MANEDRQKLRQRIRQVEAYVLALTHRVEILEEGVTPTPEIIGSLAELQVHVSLNFPTALRWQEGSVNKELCRNIRDSICELDPANTLPWSDSGQRHYDAVVRYGRVIDFATDSDGAGTLFDRLKWEDAGPYVQER